MAFRRNIKCAAEQRCEICMKPKSKGKVIELYKDILPMVCDECYATYFKDVEKMETSAAVNSRPAKIHSDRYMLRHVFKSSLIKDIYQWPIIGVIIWAICFVLSLSYPENLVAPIPMYLRLSMMIYSFFTAVELVNSIRLLICGLLRGLDVERRILLVIKIFLYLVCCAGSLAFILT